LAIPQGKNTLASARQPATLDATAIAWVTGALCATLLPHAPYLPVWVLPMFLLSAGWRLWLAKKNGPLPTRWLRLLLAMLAFALVYASQRGISGVAAGTTLLVVMLGLKMLEAKTRRDTILLLVLAYFLILAAFLREQSPVLAAYQVLATWAVTTAMLQVTRYGSFLPPREATGIAGQLMLYTLPVMLAMFLLFPRIPGPFWALPSTSSGAVTGLSNEMTPGTIAQLSQSDEVAFRVTFEGKAPLTSQLYWRGPVLEQFDGRSWSQGKWPSPSIDVSQLEYRGQATRYTVSLVPHDKAWLLALDLPAQPLPVDTRLSRRLQLETLKPVRERLVYTAVSYPDFRAPGALSDRERTFFTFLPERSNPRSQALARNMRQQASTEQAYIQAILEKFNREPYAYTLAPKRLDMRNPSDDFLFNTREGFCEFYASSFAIMMRAVGIPSRVVTGYQGGEMNPFGEYMIVRQSSAHAWVEVWLQDRGWVRVDPTAAVAPERIQRGLPDSLRLGDPLPGGLLRSVPMLADLRMAWDLANARWDEYVLGYGPELQMDLLSRFGLNMPTPLQLILIILCLAGFFLFLLSLYLARNYRPRIADPALLLYREFIRKLEKAGLTVAVHEAPGDLAKRIGKLRPDIRAQVNNVTTNYVLARYRKTGRYQLALEQLRIAVRAFRP
jgi:transglutaminase-like putative cysteine protease